MLTEHEKYWDWTIDSSGGAFRVDKEGKVYMKPLPNKDAMVRKILCALYNVVRWENKDHGDYKRLMRLPKKHLVGQYIDAKRIVSERINSKMEK